jgi:anti-anti-sigma factor
MSNSEIFYASTNSTHVLKLVGDVRLHTSKPLDDFYRYFVSTGKVQHLIIDLTEVEGIDSTGLGLLAQLAIGFTEKTNQKPALVCVSKSIQRILSAVHFDQLFIVINKGDIPLVELKNLSQKESESETEIAQRALEAHRILVSLNEANKQEFQPVVEFLEKELGKKE